MDRGRKDKESFDAIEKKKPKQKTSCPCNKFWFAELTKLFLLLNAHTRLMYAA